MTRAKALTATLVFSAALLWGAPSFAGTVRVTVDGPVVIGDQVFAGGAMEVRQVSESGLVAIRLEGRQVALAFRDPTGGGFPAHRMHVVLHRDGRGLHHLVGVRVAASTKDIPLHIAAVSRGVPAAPATAPAATEKIVRAAQ